MATTDVEQLPSLPALPQSKKLDRMPSPPMPPSQVSRYSPPAVGASVSARPSRASSPATKNGKLTPLRPGSANSRAPESRQIDAPLDSADRRCSSDKMSLCIDILMQGNVQSFIDFFYLTHKAESSPESQSTSVAEPEQDEKPPKPPDDTPLPIDDSYLVFIKERLVKAENADRNGDLQSRYQAFTELAHYFFMAGDHRRAIQFYEQCLGICKLKIDLHLEAEANKNLGTVYERIGDISTAITYNERVLVLAEMSGSETDSKSASEHLIAAYKDYANRLEQKEDHTLAAVYHEKCMNSAADPHDVANATYRLGIACQKLGEIDRAIDLMKKYLEMSRLNNDQVGEGNACHSLAQAYQSRGETSTAIQYLEIYHELAQMTGLIEAQGQACASLGVIYMKNGDFINAVQYFEKNFEIARASADRAMIDRARINLGIARGHLQMSNFIRTVVAENGLKSLLKWKNRRTPLAS